MANPIPAEQERASLVRKYENLDDQDRELLRLYSVIYAPIGKEQMLVCSTTYFRVIDQPILTRKELLSRINGLLRKKLLTSQGGQGQHCHPLIVEIVTRDAVKDGVFEAIVKVVETQLPIRSAPWNKDIRHYHSEQELLREVRIGLYRYDWDYIEEQLELYQRNLFFHSPISLSEIFELICNNPFDRDWFLTLKKDQDLFEAGLVNICIDSLMMLQPADGPFGLLHEECSRPDSDASDMMRLIWVKQLLSRGRLSEAEAALTQLATSQDVQTEVLLYTSWLRFLQGNYAETIALSNSALRFYKKESGKRKVYFDSVTGIFLVLALIREGSAASLQEAEQYAHLIAAQGYNHWLSVIYTCLEKVCQVLQGNSTAKRYLTGTPVSTLDSSMSFEVLIDCLTLYWVDLAEARKKVPRVMREFYERAIASGYDWFAMEAATLMSRLNGSLKESKQATPLQEKTGIHPLVDLIKPKEPWEISLTALAGLNPKVDTGQKTSSATTDYRLAWFLTFYSENNWTLQPKEQKISAKGGWSRGRAIALRRLKQETETFSYLTPQDLEICAQLVPEYSVYGYQNNNYEFKDRALLSLVGHPLVFWEGSPTTRVEIVKGEPALMVRQTKPGWLAISLVPEVSDKKNIAVVKETPTRIKVVELNVNHHRIAEILGPDNHLEVPESAKDQVLSAINAVSGLVMVHSDIGGGVADAEEVESHPEPHVHLLPAGDGLKVSLLTRPFGEDGPYYRPGTGGEMVVAEVGDKRLQTHRDLKAEQKLARAVENACPTLKRVEDEAGEWLIGDPEDCLELILELQDLGDKAVIEWPEGEKMRVTDRIGLSSFKMQIRQQRDWFAASGELQIGDNEVLDMQRLMELLEASPGRFVKLQDGQFLALTQEFRKRLDELRAFSEKNGNSMRFHPLASLAMEDWIDEVGQLKADKHWKEHIKRLKEVQNLKPELPSTLQADLRDYQVDGFEWLARLAHWGVGACLADDMGLGKTLQTLAVILTRAPEGPTLIVAPTSVCMNWISEAEKFAPTMNPVQLGSGDRKKLIDNLQPFDMLVCSYGLLQQEDVSEMLAEVEWQTIVLDEAQAIKNPATKRSKAAMKLQGGFKVITTGTPIENHLGELWNLFRFINPGLLGSLDQFNQKFANAIERHQDKQARNRLKKLIQPFILRRTKTQVLDELPARTEVTLQVELSAKEMAFYEALRRDAIEKLTESDAQAGAKHLQVLAEIMRLRRSCCNTRLVKKDAALPSAKLEAFGEILEELLENNHKALVFSQFVDHLSIIREFLDGQDVHYQYLDGSTPAKERQKRVNAFQAGEGDVFLISLKAGGTGLNLTAADYVIHMDPWWNPAVEDQASDRAHRIGQQRPVTIYRLVAKNTIEEKIVDLHRQKRDLADSLLEGADMSGKMSTDQLLKLISEG